MQSISGNFMLEKLKHTSLRKQTERNLSKRDISQRNTPLKHLGFLVNEAFFDDLETLNKFGTELGLEPKNIKQFTFIETRKKIPSLRSNQISNKQFNWRGEIQSENAREFLDFPLDVLIGIYNGRQDFLDAMMAESKAKFKIGFNDADDRLFDLILTVDLKKPQLFEAEVAKYLKILNKI